MTTPRHTLIAAACCTLAACSSGSLLESDTIDYQSAKKGSSLEVPPDLATPRQDERYALPGGNGASATWSDYRNARGEQNARLGNGDVLVQVPDMHIERSGDQRWLVLQGANAEKLWPELRIFWEQLGFVIQTDRPDIGVMETDWAEDRAKIPQDFIRKTIGKVFDQAFSTGLRDRFRTRLEPGQQPDTLEIYISHRGMEEVYADKNKDTTIWQPRPTDPGLESEMLRRLMIYLGQDKQKAAESVAAASAVPAASDAAAAPATDIRLVTTAGQPPYIHIGDSFDRAWRQTGVALDRSGFTVEDRNRDAGLYYIRYIDTDQARAEKGFFSKLAFWRSDREGNGNAYRILVKEISGASQVSVLNAEGKLESSDTARRILTVLTEKLK